MVVAAARSKVVVGRSTVAAVRSTVGTAPTVAHSTTGILIIIIMEAAWLSSAARGVGGGPTIMGTRTMDTHIIGIHRQRTMVP